VLNRHLLICVNICFCRIFYLNFNVLDNSEIDEGGIDLGCHDEKISDSETDTHVDEAVESSAFSQRRFSPAANSPALFRGALRPKPIKMVGDSQELRGSSDDEPQMPRSVNFKPTGGVFRAHNPRHQVDLCGDLIEGSGSKARSESRDGYSRTSRSKEEPPMPKLTKAEAVSYSAQQKQQPIKSIKNIVMIPSTTGDTISVTTIQTAVFSKQSTRFVSKLPTTSSSSDYQSAVTATVGGPGNEVAVKGQSLLLSKAATPSTPTTPGAKPVRSLAPSLPSTPTLASSSRISTPQTINAVLVPGSSALAGSAGIVRTQPVVAGKSVTSSRAVSVVSGLPNSPALLSLSQAGGIIAAVSSAQLASLYPSLVLKPSVVLPSATVATGAAPTQLMSTISLAALATQQPTPQTPPLTPTQLQYIVPLIQTSGDGRPILQMFIPGQPLNAVRVQNRFSCLGRMI
jgi:hypothetical protein